MLRKSILLMLLLPAAALFACGGSSTPTETPPASGASSDTCPIVSPGPPPVCPEGCEWNGTECRKHSSIIMPDARDGGTPPAQ